MSSTPSDHVFLLAATGAVADSSLRRKVSTSRPLFRQARELPAVEDAGQREVENRVVGQ
jgi:hypothetical protein